MATVTHLRSRGEALAFVEGLALEYVRLFDLQEESGVADRRLARVERRAREIGKAFGVDVGKAMDKVLATTRD